jgi:hypothetical protein
LAIIKDQAQKITPTVAIPALLITNPYAYFLNIGFLEINIF